MSPVMSSRWWLNERGQHEGILAECEDYSGKPIFAKEKTGTDTTEQIKTLLENGCVIWQRFNSDPGGEVQEGSRQTTPS